MVNVLLYCSYSGSAVGYQKAVVDKDQKIVRSPQKGEIPKLVDQIWTHGGAIAAAGVSDGTPYFLMKRIEYQNENKQLDEQGRKVFMNCAFTGSNHKELQQFADGFFSFYQAAVKKLGDLLVVDDTEIGYTIQDFDGLHALVSFCVEAGKRVRVSQIGTLEGAISFVALEGDWAYFVKQNSIPAASKPATMLESKAYQRMLEKGQKDLILPEPETPPPRRPDARPVTKPERPAETVENSKEIKKPPATEREASAAKTEKPPAAPESQRDMPRPDYEKSLKDMERHITDTLLDKLEQEKTTSHQRAEEQNSRLERQGFWIKVAIVLSAVAVLLTLILHNWGGGK